MNFYEQWILPRLVDVAMRNKEATRYRSQIVPQARGSVLEIGVGSGLNLPFYGADVEQLYALDPSEELLTMARKKARDMALPVKFITHSGEAIPLDTGSVDTVVTTWTLCTIPDPVQALKEMRRVLKPDGVMLFAEHGLAPEANVQGWQRRLNPLWRRIAGGCNLDRKIDQLMQTAGFQITAIEMNYAKGPRPMSYVYAGQAQPGTSDS